MYIADECQLEGKSVDAAGSVVTTTVSEADKRVRTDYDSTCIVQSNLYEWNE